MLLTKPQGRNIRSRAFAFVKVTSQLGSLLERRRELIAKDTHLPSSAISKGISSNLRTDVGISTKPFWMKKIHSSSTKLLLWRWWGMQWRRKKTTGSLLLHTILPNYREVTMCQPNLHRSTVSASLPMKPTDTVSRSHSSRSDSLEDKMEPVKPLKVLLCSENVPRK